MSSMGAPGAICGKPSLTLHPLRENPSRVRLRRRYPRLRPHPRSWRSRYSRSRSRYSPLQRARAYGELARWLGADSRAPIPGVVTVAAITDDFPDQMFRQRGDDEHIPPLLEVRGLPDQAAMARSGI